jgi:hypothetical protein
VKTRVSCTSTSSGFAPGGGFCGGFSGGGWFGGAAGATDKTAVPVAVSDVGGLASRSRVTCTKTIRIPSANVAVT